MESKMAHDIDLNLKETELRLGLPGMTTEDPREMPAPAVARSNKRALPEYAGESNRHTQIAPPTKEQVVGWPPIRSFRKNSLQTVKKVEPENSGMYVKVSMDGAPYLRKIDLNGYKSYPELLQALENMFKCTIGDYSESDGYNGSEYAATYEDKDGDWMLAGDVPWEMFRCSCKRLRIMKASGARGLGCP